MPGTEVEARNTVINEIHTTTVSLINNYTHNLIIIVFGINEKQGMLKKIKKWSDETQSVPSEATSLRRSH